jgi:hypothetical protein
MKKIYVFALALVCFYTASAQDKSESKMDIGFKAGMNFSSLGDLPDDYEKDGLKLGYTGGVFVRFKTGLTGAYFQPEVNISQSGGNTKYTNFLSEDIEIATQVTSIDVPLLLGLRVGSEAFGIHLHAGPFASRLIDTQSTLKGAGLETETDVIEQTNKFQAGFQIGGGVEFGPVMISVRYQHNITKLYKDNATLDYVTGDSKISLVQATLGIKLF